MANETRNMRMFDENGILTEEIMLAYVSGRLSAQANEDVEKHLAESALYMEAIEGMSHLPAEEVAELLRHINQKVAQRSGAELRKSQTESRVSRFLQNNRRIAAAATILLLSGGMAALLLLPYYQPHPSASKMELSAPEPPASPLAENQPAPESTTPSAPPEKIQNDTEAPPESLTETAHVSTTTATQSHPDEKNEQPAITAARTLQQNPTSQSQTQQALKSTASLQTPPTSSSPSHTGTSEQNGFSPQIDNTIKTEIAAPEEAGNNERDRTPQVTLQEEATIIAEQMPQFPGGEAAFRQYIRKNLRYPEKSKEQGIEGKVYLSFVVGSSGRIKDIRVVQGVNKEINAEAIRLIANMPAWQPGKKNGRPVAVKQYLTIEFSLTEKGNQ
ncbi:MAG: hypothetical protein KatS3mg031_1841 [Chitinophagales bacterium]|nr:MAG: hypothetical protein KatS3mg031_1841 [Chitinophagales bacterium]